MELNIEQVNKVPAEEFIKVFGNVVENYPAAAAAVVKERPFQSPDGISHAVNKYLGQLCDVDKEHVLRLHPDLAGKMADLGQMSAESASEQKSVGLDVLSIEDKNKLGRFNEMYKDKFGFPFVICVRENKLPTILREIELRMKNDKYQELAIGIEEVKKISKLRIFQITAL